MTPELRPQFKLSTNNKFYEPARAATLRSKPEDLLQSLSLALMDLEATRKALKRLCDETIRQLFDSGTTATELAELIGATKSTLTRRLAETAPKDQTLKG